MLETLLNSQLLLHIPALLLLHGPRGLRLVLFCWVLINLLKGLIDSPGVLLSYNALRNILAITTTIHAIPRRNEDLAALALLFFQLLNLTRASCAHAERLAVDFVVEVIG